MTTPPRTTSTHMRIAVLRGAHDFVVERAPVPTIASDEVLVKVAASGVCSSELEPWLGDDAAAYPRYLGHEVSGSVVEVGSAVTGLELGDPVGVWVTSHGFAEYVAVPAAHCRVVRDIPLDEVLIEPLACAANAVELTDVRLGDDVVIVGAGFMGNLVQQLVNQRGPRHLIVADARPDALAVASRLGATRTVLVTEESLPAVVAEVTGGRGADVTFECTGSQLALDGLADVTRMSGKVVLVGFHQGGSRSIALAYWNWMAFTIVNGHFRELSTIMRGMTIAARMLESGKVTLSPLVTHRFGLNQVNEAFQSAVTKPAGFVKAVITFEDAGQAD